MLGCLTGIMNCDKFYCNRFRGFDFVGGGGQNSRIPCSKRCRQRQVVLRWGLCPFTTSGLYSWLCFYPTTPYQATSPMSIIWFPPAFKTPAARSLTPLVPYGHIRLGLPRSPYDDVTPSYNHSPLIQSCRYRAACDGKFSAEYRPVCAWLFAPLPH